MRQFTVLFALVSILAQEYWGSSSIKRNSRRDVIVGGNVGGGYASQECLKVYQYFAQTGINLLLTAAFWWFHAQQISVVQERGSEARIREGTGKLILRVGGRIYPQLISGQVPSHSN